MSNILTTSELSLYRQAIIDELALNPTNTGTQLLVVVDALEVTQKTARLTQVVDNLKSTRPLPLVQGGVMDVAVTVDTADTLYVADTTFPVTDSAGEGTGAIMTILTVGGGGEILTAEITSLGSTGYNTPVVDLSGAGNASGAVTVTASAITAEDQSIVLDEMIAAI